jgi:hypothetical protein
MFPYQLSSEQYAYVSAVPLTQEEMVLFYSPLAGGKPIAAKTWIGYNRWKDEIHTSSNIAVNRGFLFSVVSHHIAFATDTSAQHAVYDLAANTFTETKVHGPVSALALSKPARSTAPQRTRSSVIFSQQQRPT